MASATGYKTLVPNYSKFRYYVNSKLDRLVFRRIRSVTIDDTDLVVYNLWRHNALVASAPVHALTPEFTLSEQEIEKNLEIRARNFSFITNSKAIRDDGYKNLFAESDNYAEIDVLGLSFNWFCPRSPDGTIVVPRQNDLVCGEVDPLNPNRFKRWFICSEQFMRFWTLMRYDTHDSFAKNKDLYTYVMSGNRLCTNNYQKWAYANLENGIVPDPVESNKRYYRLRTELASQEVHVYAALVLLGRYGELPGSENVPNNLKGQRNLSWILPPGFIDSLFHTFDLRVCTVKLHERLV